MQSLTVTDIIAVKDKPVVAIDGDGIITLVNKAFEEVYGWQSEELVGGVITAIIPPYMRDAHNFGFSRFLTTEESRILGKTFQLPVYCKDGSVLTAEHYIVGEKLDGKWRFAATITRSEAN